jgi:hypothetical protein
LRQNNTGKLLWQVFGIQAAPLCLFGIQEHEDIMWDAFQRSGCYKSQCQLSSVKHMKSVTLKKYTNAFRSSHFLYSSLH